MVYNIKFASKAEARFYLYITSKYPKYPTILQPKFLLQEGKKLNNKVIRPIYYIADFQIGNMVIDVKGIKTQVFRLKEKLFIEHYPHLTLYAEKLDKLLTIF